MIEQPSNTPGARPDTADSAGVGMLLRASRQRVGEELRDVAAMLRIRYPYLEAIEEGRHTALPGQTYAIGFVRAYAEHLGLDSEEVVRRYKAEIASRGGRHDLHFPTPMAETGIPGGAIVFVGLVVAVLVYGGWYLSTAEDGFLSDLVAPLPERLAALVSRDGAPAKPETPAKEATPMKPAAELAPVASAEAKPADAKPADAKVEPAQTEASKTEPVQVASTPTEPAKPEPAKTEVATTPEPEKTPAAAAETAPAPAATPPADKPAATEAVPAANAKPPASQPAPKPAMAEPALKPADIPPAAAASAPAPTTAPTTPAPAAASTPAMETAALPAKPPAEHKPSRIIVKATANSWIEVHDDFSNTTLVSRMLQAGESYEVPDKTGLSLLTGNAGALEIVVDGTKVPSIGGNGAVRRGVQLIPELLKAGTATQ